MRLIKEGYALLHTSQTNVKLMRISDKYTLSATTDHVRKQLLALFPTSPVHSVIVVDYYMTVTDTSVVCSLPTTTTNQQQETMP